MNMPGKLSDILLVDDDMVLRGMATRTLRHAGFSVHAVDSGEAGLSAFEGGQFDLILLDVMLPGISGFDVCERIRALPTGLHVPILMLTGLDDTASVDEAFRRGATDFITKPINWTLLSHRIRFNLRAAALADTAMRQRAQMSAAQRLARLGSWEWVPHTDEVTCSEQMMRLLGRPTGGHLTDFESMMTQVSAADRATVASVRRNALSTGKPYQIKYAIDREEGGERVLMEEAEVERDALGRIVTLRAIVQDITDRVAAQQRIDALSFKDDLTGLPNRQYFNEVASGAIERSLRLRKSSAVLFFDLDRFKAINDSLGHEGGNAVLCKVGWRIQRCVRGADMLARCDDSGQQEPVARLAGDSFIVLLVDLADDSVAERVCTRVLNALAEPLMIDGQAQFVTASAGISVYPRDASDVPGLIQAAEQAMYAAKKAGRARLAFFSEELNRQSYNRAELDKDFRRGLMAGEMCLYFQPKVDARSGAMIGAESLIRWAHPEQGVLAPGHFIQVAEETGLIIPMTDTVMQMACASLARWADAGLRLVPLAINVPAPYFAIDDAVERLASTARSYGVEPSMLTIEITESLLMNDAEGTLERLNALKAEGFRLSLDDFGTGYSSLSYLHRFPIDELKIDRAFVKDIDQGERNAIIATSILMLGEQFGLRVVAEGVETEAQSQRLLAAGGHVQQGYFFSKPLCEADFEAKLRPL